MSFEATKNFRKKATSDTTDTGSNAATGRFEATSNFRRDEAYDQRRYNEMERQVNDIISRYNGIIKQAQKYTSGGEKKSAAPNIRYRAGDTIGVGNDYADFSTAYSLGRSAAKLRKEASELMSTIQGDYGSGNTIEKLAAVQVLNSIANESFDDEISNEYIGRMPYTSYNVRKQALRQYLDDKKIEKKYGVNDDTSAIELIGKAEGITVPKAASEKQEASADAKKAYSEEKSRIEKEYGITLSYDDYEENVLKLQELMKTLPAGEEKQRVLDFSKIDPTIYNYKMTAGGSDTPTVEEKKKQQKFEAAERTGYNYIEVDRDTLQKEKDYLRYLASQRITMDDWNAINEGEAYTDDVARDYKVSAIINNAKSKEDFKEKSKIGDEEKESLRFDSSPLSTSETAKKKFFGGGTLDSAFDLSASYDEITNGMSEDEKNVFNYILNTEGKTAATEYRQLLNRDSEFSESIGARKGHEFYEKNLKGHPILTALYSVQAGLLGQFGSNIQNIGDFARGTTPDPKEHTELSAIEEAKANSGRLGRTVLDMGMFLGDNAPAAMIGAAAGAAAKGFGATVKTAQDIANTASAGSMFLSAGSAAYTQAIEEGYSAERAQKYGVLTGVSEAYLEKALGGIAGMTGKITGKTVKAAIKNIEDALLRMLTTHAVDMAGEFTEEYLQEILDPVFRNITLDENNEFKPFTADALYAGFLGALGAATMNAGPLAIEATSYAKNKAQRAAGTVRTGQELIGTEAGRQIAELGKEIGKDRLVEKATADVKERRGLGKIVQKIEEARQGKHSFDLASEVITAEGEKAANVAEKFLKEKLGDKYDEAYTAIAVSSALGDKATANAAILSLEEQGRISRDILDTIAKAETRISSETRADEIAKIYDSIDNGDYDMKEPPVTSREIAAVRREGGKIVYITNDGREVGENKVRLPIGQETLFKDSTEGLTETESREMISTYREYAPKSSPALFGALWNSAREYGRLTNDSRTRLSEIDMSGLGVSEKVQAYIRKLAYDQGIEARAESIRQQNIQKKAREVIEKRKSGKARGEVRGAELVENVQNKKAAKATAEVAEVLARAGYDVEFFTGEKTVGSRKLAEIANGAWDPETNTIYLRADAKYEKGSARGILGDTLAHEVTHSIKTWNLEGYKELSGYVADALGIDSVESLAGRWQNERGMSYEAAFDDVMANGCEKMLQNSQVLQRMATENANLFVRIGEKIKAFVKKIRNALKNMYGENAVLHPETEAVMSAVSDMQEFQQVFDNALEDSITNMRDALAKAENAKTRENLDVLEKHAEKEGVQLSKEFKESQTTDFYKRLDSWDKKTTGFSFVIGNASDALIDAGIPNKQIRIDASKIKKLLSKHPGIDINTVKGLVELLNHPVVVIDSKTNANSRVVMGELHDKNGKIVTAVLLLTPTNRKGNELDVIKVSSLEGRGHIESLFRYEDNSPVKIRYFDKKRIQNWLNANRLQLPLRSFNLDSDNSITQQAAKSQEENIKFSEELPASGTDEQQKMLDFMESAAKTDTERLFVSQFKAKTEAAAKYEADIKDINRTLRNIRRGKAGSEDASTVKALESEKRRLYKALKKTGADLEVYRGYKTYTKLLDRYHKQLGLDMATLERKHSRGLEKEASRQSGYLTREIAKRSERFSNLALENSTPALRILAGMYGRAVDFEKTNNAEYEAQIKKSEKTANELSRSIDWIEKQRQTIKDNAEGLPQAVVNKKLSDFDNQWNEALKQKRKQLEASRRKAEKYRSIMKANAERAARFEAEYADYEAGRGDNAVKFNRGEYYLYEDINKFARSVDGKNISEFSESELKTAAYLAERLEDAIHGKSLDVYAKKKTDTLKSSYAERKAQETEQAVRRKYIEGIAKMGAKLNTLATKETKAKHIPSSMKKTAAIFGLGVNFDTFDKHGYFEKRINRLSDLISQSEAREQKLESDRQHYLQRAEELRNTPTAGLSDSQLKTLRKNIEYFDNLAKRREAQLKALPAEVEKYRSEFGELQDRVSTMDRFAAELAELYQSYIDQTDGATTQVYDADLAMRADELVKSVKGKALYEMSTEELSQLYELTVEISAAITNANKMFMESRSVADTAETVRGQIVRKESRYGDNRAKLAMHQGSQNLMYKVMKPWQLFERTGSEKMAKLYQNLQRQEGNYARLIRKYSEYYTLAAEENGITQTMLGEKHTFTLDSGEVTALTGSEIMTMYGVSGQKEGMLHLTDENGGFRLEGKVKRAPKGSKNKYVYVEGSNPVKLTANDVTRITQSLTEKQRAFVDSLQQYMANEMGSERNKVDIVLYDVERNNNPNYFPLATDSSFRNRRIAEQEGKTKIKNMGSTHERVEGANNPLIIRGINKVWSEHANDTALYASFVLPLEDVEKVLNYSDGAFSMKNALGDRQSDAMLKFLATVNGGIRRDDVGISKLFNLSKASRVGFNLRVAIQQPTAIIRATALIDAKYLFGWVSPKQLSEHMGSELLKEMAEHSSTWNVKKLGGVDVNTSGALSDTLTDLGSGKKVSSKIKTGVDTAAFWLAEKGDQVAWINLWLACKREQHALHPELSGEALLKAVGERFDEITNKTQVYDSVFSRANILTSNNAFAKLTTQFMSESLTTANMMMEAWRLGRQGKKTQAARIVASVVVNIILTNAAASLIDAVRDDDDDESFLEKYLSSLAGNILQDINPANYIPIVKDAITILQGYDVSRGDLDLLAELVDDAKSLSKGIRNGEDLTDALLRFGAKVFDVIGVPASSLLRDTKAVVTLLEKTIRGENAKTTWTSMGAAMHDVRGELPGAMFFHKKRSTTDKLYYATLNKDSAYLERAVGNLTEELEGKGKSKKEIRSAIDQKIKKGLQDNDLRIAAAAQARIEGDTEEYLSCVKAVVNDGFTEKQTVSAILALENELNGDDEGVDRYISGIPYTKTDIQRELEAGNTAPLEEFYAQKFTEKSAEDDVKNPAKEARQAAANMLGNIYSEPYKRAYDDGDTDECERITELLLDVEIEGYRLLKYKTIVGWKDKKLSDDEEEEE